MSFRAIVFLIISLLCLALAFAASEGFEIVEPGLHTVYFITAYRFRFVLVAWLLFISFLYFRSHKKITPTSRRFFIAHVVVTALPRPFVYFSLFIYPFVADFFNSFVSSESLSSFYYFNEGVWIGFIVAQVFFAVMLGRSIKVSKQREQQNS